MPEAIYHAIGDPHQKIDISIDFPRLRQIMESKQQNAIPAEVPRVGELTAYRIWRVNGYILRSLSFDQPWIPGSIMEGDPARPALGTPGQGVYAFKKLVDAEIMASWLRIRTWLTQKVTQGKQITQAQMPQTHLVGAVKLWGNVVEHEHGYRAQFARIISLIAASQAINRLYLQGAAPDKLTEVRDMDGKLVGVTTLWLPTDRNFVMIYKKEPPIVAGPSTISNSTTINQHCFEIKTLAASGRRCLCVCPNQDVTVLPGWLPWGWPESALSDGQ